MDILSTLFFVLLHLYLSVDSTIAAGGTRFSFRSGYSGSRSGGGNSTTAGILAGCFAGGIILAVVFIVLVPACKRKCTDFKLRRSLKQVHVVETPNKNLPVDFSESNSKNESKKKSNLVGTVQAVSKFYGKAMANKKKRKRNATNTENNTGGLPDTAPPPYDELEYRPRVSPSYASSKSAFPPTAFDYGYQY